MSAESSGPGASDAAAPSTETEVRAVLREMERADSAGDLDGILATYADDAVWLPPGEPPLRGRDNLRPRYADLFARFEVEVRIEVQQICCGADMAIAHGHTRVVLTPRDGGEPTVGRDAYLLALRRTPAGWRVSHLMWSPESSPPRH